jgi:hypothetical protein
MILISKPAPLFIPFRLTKKTLTLTRHFPLNLPTSQDQITTSNSADNRKMDRIGSYG